MLIKLGSQIKSSEITPKSVYLNRRQIMVGAASTLALGSAGIASAAKLDFQSSPFSTDEDVTPKEAATTYNNFYEFGTRKEDPARLAGEFTTARNLRQNMWRSKQLCAQTRCPASVALASRCHGHMSRACDWMRR